MKKEMKPEDIRRAGWALILADVSFFLSIFTGMSAKFARPLLVFVSLPLLVYGVLGLRQRYGEKVGSFGKNILLIGAVLGPITSLIGYFLLRVGRYWFITYTGHAVLFTCLTLFGVVALYTKPMPRWNILPIIAGLSFPVLEFSYIGTGLATGYWERGIGIPDSLINILIAIQVCALAALGYVLQADVPEETVALA